MWGQATIRTLVQGFLAEEERAGRTFSVAQEDDKWHLLQDRKFPRRAEYQQRVLDYLRKNWTPERKDVTDYTTEFQEVILKYVRDDVQYGESAPG